MTAAPFPFPDRLILSAVSVYNGCDGMLPIAKAEICHGKSEEYMQVPHIRDYVGKRIHMIGIGGSSMSGLAEMLLEEGYQVTGSDRSDGYLLGKQIGRAHV